MAFEGLLQPWSSEREVEAAKPLAAAQKSKGRRNRRMERYI